MQFPIIRHIEDVLPHIEGRKEFVVLDKEDYTVIDYEYTLSDSFDDVYRRECRGIKFDKDGNILARPFHKFFNYGEKPETTDIDWCQPHNVYDKLDGSMIHPSIVKGDIVFMTRKGVTEVSEQAYKEYTESTSLDVVTKNTNFMRLWLTICFTPLYEYTSPNNRIVVPYKDVGLRLIGMRNNLTGEYIDISQYRMYGIDVVSEYGNNKNNTDRLVDSVRKLPADSHEGVVVHFSNGLFVKIKSDEYVKFHRAKDSLASEKRVLPIVLENKLDDVLPLLSKEDRDKLNRYSFSVYKSIDNYIEKLVSDFYSIVIVHGSLNTMIPDDNNRNIRRYASGVMNRLNFHPIRKAIIFKLLDNPRSNIREELVKLLLKRCRTNNDIESIREIIGDTKWN